MKPVTRSIRLFAVLVALLAFADSALAAKRPNFVFVISEDNSIHYSRLYGNPLGMMPNIEKMAKSGLVFDNAFSCSPVCSVARTTLATGIYAPRGGFQYHRKSQPAHLPEGLKMWSAQLREAGYYAANNRKKDYNVIETEGTWDESSKNASWRKRKEGQPFFHMQSFTTTHESSLHFSEKVMKNEKTKTPPKDVKLAPYHPDTPTFRYTYARYHDRIRQVDEQIGKVIDRLKEDGVLEDTFVFYFGDHGGVLPRGKGYAYESGLHVPLVVRIPKNFQHLAANQPGSRVQGFVEFIDFGPTVLHLAGLEVPEALDGEPFLGPGISTEELDARDESFGYADRFDEKYDLVRTFRKGKYHYIRNYQAYYPDGLQNNYRYRMLAYQEWRELYRRGQLNAVQRQFFEARPAEQLFDVEADPHEVNNLADDPEYASILKDLRKRLTRRVKSVNDLSFYPESHMVDHALADPIAFGEEHSREIARLVDTADLQLRPFDKAKGKLEKAIQSDNEWERYWGLTSCAVFGEEAKSLASAARPRLDDNNLMVRLRAAEFLGLAWAADPRPTFYEILNTTKSDDEALLTFNGVVLFNDFKPHYKFDLSQLKDRKFGGQVGRRLEYLRGE